MLTLFYLTLFKIRANFIAYSSLLMLISVMLSVLKNCKSTKSKLNTNTTLYANKRLLRGFSFVRVFNYMVLRKPPITQPKYIQVKIINEPDVFGGINRKIYFLFLITFHMVDLCYFNILESSFWPHSVLSNYFMNHDIFLLINTCSLFNPMIMFWVCLVGTSS